MSKPQKGTKRIGVYELGYEHVELYARDDGGGSFWLQREKNELPRIEVGMQEQFQVCVNALVHEAMEFAFARLSCRYVPAQRVCKDSGGYIFFFTHAVWAEVCGNAAEFLTGCWYDFRREWKRRQR